MSPYRTEVVAVTVPPRATKGSGPASKASTSQLQATSGSSGSAATASSRSAWMYATNRMVPFHASSPSGSNTQDQAAESVTFGLLGHDVGVRVENLGPHRVAVRSETLRRADGTDLYLGPNPRSGHRLHGGTELGRVGCRSGCRHRSGR